MLIIYSSYSKIFNGNIAGITILYPLRTNTRLNSQFLSSSLHLNLYPPTFHNFNFHAVPPPHIWFSRSHNSFCAKSSRLALPKSLAYHTRLMKCGHNGERENRLRRYHIYTRSITSRTSSSTAYPSKTNSHSFFFCYTFVMWFNDDPFERVLTRINGEIRLFHTLFKHSLWANQTRIADRFTDLQLANLTRTRWWKEMKNLSKVWFILFGASNI